QMASWRLVPTGHVAEENNRAGKRRLERLLQGAGPFRRDQHIVRVKNGWVGGEMNHQRPALAVTVVHTQDRHNRVESGGLSAGFASIVVVMPAAVARKALQALGAEANSSWRHVFGGRNQSLCDGPAHGLNDGWFAFAELQLPELLRENRGTIMSVGGTQEESVRGQPKIGG